MIKLLAIDFNIHTPTQASLCGANAVVFGPDMDLVLDTGMSAPAAPVLSAAAQPIDVTGGKHAETEYFKTSVQRAASSTQLQDPPAAITIQRQKMKLQFMDLLASLASNSVSMGTSLPTCLKFDNRGQYLQVLKTEAGSKAVQLVNKASTGPIIKKIKSRFAEG